MPATSMSNEGGVKRRGGAASSRNDSNAPVSAAEDTALPPKPPSAWKDLPRRLLTVTLGVPSIILLLRHPVTSWLFFQGAHILCILEWRALVPVDATENAPSTAANDATKEGAMNRILAAIFTNTTADSSPLSTCMFRLFSVFSILIAILPTYLLPLAYMTYGIVVRLIPHLPNLQSYPTNAKEIQHYQFGLLYLSAGFHFILQISRVGGPIHIGNLLFIVWMSDTGALILGRSMKRKNENATTEHKGHGALLSFLKSVSPGKSLPGLWGAIITGPICAAIYPIQLSTQTIHDVAEQCNGEGSVAISTIMQWLRPLANNALLQKAFLGLTVALAGIVGDLAESSVKRLSKKKDSGRLLPGHGGVVDRFDSLFVAGIVYYYWLSKSDGIIQ